MPQGLVLNVYGCCTYLETVQNANVQFHNGSVFPQLVGLCVESHLLSNELQGSQKHKRRLYVYFWEGLSSYKDN